MFVSHMDLNGRHLTTAFCRQVEERKWHRLEEEEARAGEEAAFTAYRVPLAPVTSFRYLGKVLLVYDDNWMAVVHNLHKAHRKWERLTWVLSRDGADGSDERTLG